MDIIANPPVSKSFLPAIGRIVKESTVPKSSNARRSVAALPVTTVLLLAVAVTGCSKKVEKTEDIRPVRTMTVAPAGTRPDLSGLSPSW